MTRIRAFIGWALVGAPLGTGAYGGGGTTCSGTSTFAGTR